MLPRIPWEKNPPLVRVAFALTAETAEPGSTPVNQFRSTLDAGGAESLARMATTRTRNKIKENHPKKDESENHQKIKITIRCFATYNTSNLKYETTSDLGGNASQSLVPE